MKISSDTPVVLFVGTDFRNKGLHDLLGLWERHELPGAYLLVVGKMQSIPTIGRGGVGKGK
jgi:hypothetical protein